MRFVSRTTRSLLEQQRERSSQKRAAAGTLARSFPRVEEIQVQLQFLAANGVVPAAQMHALYPSAPAYFEFSCPYGDCDGSFDLNAVALPMLRKSESQAEGSLQCQGTRTAGGMARRPCTLRADFWINARYEASVRAAG